MTQKEKVQKGYKCHEKHDCKHCPYYDGGDIMRDPRIDPNYSVNVMEDIKKCRDALIADMAGMIEEQEERIAIMAERPVSYWETFEGKPVGFLADGMTPKSGYVGVYCHNCRRNLVGSDEYACDGKYCPACGAEMIEKAGD